MTRRHRFAAAGLAAALTLTPIAGVTASTLGATVAQAAPSSSQSASSAASWLGAQLTGGQYMESPYTGNPDVSMTSDVLIGLVAGGNRASAQKVNGWLQKNVSKASSTGQLAKIAIAAEAIGEDPANYGGHDLIKEITEAVDKAKGDLGDPFSNSLALIAIKGASDKVPDDLVASLIKQQNAEGEFFFPQGNWPDPDATGLAIQALDGVEGDGAGAALNKAVAWATKNQKSAGYWDSYSPANTTGLIGSALQEQGKDVSKALAWMKGQQLKDGSLPPELNGTDGDALATAQGLLLLSGMTLNTVSLPGGEPTTAPTSTSTTPSPTPTSTGSATATATGSATSMPAGSDDSGDKPSALPSTGAEGPSHAGELGALALGFVAVGTVGGALALRARRNS